MKICSNKFVEKESYMSSDAELAPFKRQGKRQSSEISAGTPSQTTKATGDTSEAKNADSPKLSWEHTSRSPYNQHDPHEMIMEVEVKQSIEQDVRDVIDPRNVGKIVTLLMELDWRYPTEYCIGGEAERGLCTGNYSRWSFYKDDGVCKPFEYGGNL
uniref:BPTI/Kunitz inhibitor domain-containing protein n=1 Tax=Spongospora subterranea TaxID=70186 RepID=A0A0H5RFL8_9EUKA|eukprot:CRZ12337.1 hypothetical protein [Spongospora subterranea]